MLDVLSKTAVRGQVGFIGWAASFHFQCSRMVVLRGLARLTRAVSAERTRARLERGGISFCAIKHFPGLPCCPEGADYCAIYDLRFMICDWRKGRPDI